MSPAQAFSEAAQARAVSYAPWLSREASRAALQRIALPEPRCETWRYTNTNRWYAAAPTASAERLEAHGSAAARIVPFEAANATERRHIAQHLNAMLDRERCPLAIVNDILLDRGVLIRVRAGADAEATLGDLGGGFERVLVIVEAGASFVLTEPLAAPRQRIVEVLLEPGATLQHARLQPPTAAVEHHVVAVRASADAAYRLAQYGCGAGLRRNDLQIAAAGAGASIEVRAAYRLGAGQHLDTHVALRHAAPAATSRQLARGVVGAKAKAVFEGRIHIAPRAQRSDATLAAKHLLLAPDAAAYAKPELEIYADDVKCSHGATVGELDAQTLFYLRSRGVDEARARQLLVAGFLEEAIDGPASAAARTLLEAA